MFKVLHLSLLLCCLITLVKLDDSHDNKNGREKKFLSVFQIVQFPNDPCVGTSSRNGTCYTENECTTKDGIAAGSCASGFGVCCAFMRGCGGSSAENCTTFEVGSGSVSSGSCSMTVCPCNTNICQLRLDFSSFTIAGPSTSTDEVVRLLNGLPARLPTASAVPASVSTRCLVDTFSVTNPGGPTPPVICGSNNGAHMYVDSSPQCNTLDFQIGDSGATTRQWSIKVTQYACDSELLAPEGCTQYYYGNTNDIVQTYNFDGGLHLANQNQAICVRQERNNCRICWSAQSPTDFKVSGKSTIAASLRGHDGQENCCRYGANGINTNGYDCFVIHGAEHVTNGDHEVSRICGRSEGLIGQINGEAPTTLCSTTTPFMVTFNSDNFEFTGTGREAQTASADIGVKVAFFQDNTNCFASQ